MHGTTMYVVTIGDRKHTLKDWAEVTHLCAKSFVSDPETPVEIRHVRNPESVGDCLPQECTRGKVCTVVE